VNVCRAAWPKARRIALVSDTHGHLDAAVLAALTAADLVVHAGDVGNAQVLEALGALAPVAAVAGNNDAATKWPPGEADVVAALPEAIEIALAGGSLVVVHGHQWPRARQRHARLRARWPAARAIVYGHSHRRVTDTDETPWVLNPGAAGRARTYGGASWLALTVGRGRWRVAGDGF
jgi:hypothetical protein